MNGVRAASASQCARPGFESQRRSTVQASECDRSGFESQRRSTVQASRVAAPGSSRRDAVNPSLGAPGAASMPRTARRLEPGAATRLASLAVAALRSPSITQILGAMRMRSIEWRKHSSLVRRSSTTQRTLHILVLPNVVTTPAPAATPPPRRMHGPGPIGRAVRGRDAEPGAPMDGFTASRPIVAWTVRSAGGASRQVAHAVPQCVRL